MEAKARHKTVCVDLDGTLCTNTWGAYAGAEPIPWAIARVNLLAGAGHRIVIFTARGTATGIDWEAQTRAQLDRWGVPYDELRFGKPSADVYLDDRAVHTDAWRCEDLARVPGLGIAADAGPEELPALIPSYLATVVESGRTFAGRAAAAPEHAARLLRSAGAAGIESRPAEEIAGAIIAAATEAVRVAGGDVVFTAALVAPPSAFHLDVFAKPEIRGPLIRCRALTQVAEGLRDLLADPSHGVAVAASSTGEPATWPLRVSGRDGVSDALGGELGIVDDGQLVVAPGASLRERAARAGIDFREGRLELERLLSADEAFICGLPFCILPIAVVDGHPIGGAASRPVADRLLQAWSAEVGVDLASQMTALVRA